MRDIARIKASLCIGWNLDIVPSRPNDHTLEVWSTNFDCYEKSYILLAFEVNAANNNIVCDSGSNGNPHCK
jgi:hypothetical protein